jgi:ribosome biogenesis protein ENP2
MKVSTFSGCKVYDLSAGSKNLPQWMSEKKKRAMAKDDDYRRRLELIQDFEMPAACHCLKMTNDGEHVIATGAYPPIVKCYTVSDMSLKFQRGLTAEVVAFETLSDNFGKLVFMQTDRTLNFHAPYGTHYSLRIPKFGRDLKYNWGNCDLYVASSGNEVYRLNLETGIFKEPFEMSYTGCNKIEINPVHQLLACGGESSAVEFWDSRSRKAVSRITVASTQGESHHSCEISSLKFDKDGLTLGVGTSQGNCLLYDIRSNIPMYNKEHQYGLPIIDIDFHDSGHIISTDKKVIKIWQRGHTSGDSQGKILTNIETPCDINTVNVVKDTRGKSGLLFVAGEQPKIMSYFLPQLGPAPRWCSFLESLTEELEETSLVAEGAEGGAGKVYEDYKFLTKAEVEELSAGGLIGTPALKGYMHGFFMEMKLYSKLRAVSKPFEYEEHRKKKIREKIDEKRQSRINAKKRLPKVNPLLAEKFMKMKKSKKGEEEDIVDDRFASLFKRSEFEQDQESHEFKLRNPSGGPGTGGRGGDDSEDDDLDNFTPVQQSNYLGRGGVGR